jgi:hypothetical protein
VWWTVPSEFPQQPIELFFGLGEKDRRVTVPLEMAESIQQEKRLVWCPLVTARVLAQLRGALQPVHE